MLAAAVMSAFLAAFGGTWTCASETPGVPHPHGTRWTIAAAPHSSWTRVQFSPAHDGGVAYVGWLAPARTWIYEDFHDDGSYATNASPGPVAGVWTWTGAYTSADRVLHYAVQWRRDGATIRRAFGRMIGTSFRPSAGDLCRPA